MKPADVDAAADVLKTAHCIVLQFEIPVKTVYYTVAFARTHGIRCILNPAPAQPVDIAGQRLVASITVESVDDLGLSEGSEVTAVIKASDVIIATE